MKNKIDFKYSKRRFSNTLTYKLSVTVSIALSIFCFILIMLYTIGNYQNFQDKNQEFLLSALSYISIFNSMFSFVLIIETVIKLFAEKNKFKNILNTIVLILSMIFCIFCTTTSNIISYISRGIK